MLRSIAVSALLLGAAFGGPVAYGADFIGYATSTQQQVPVSTGNAAPFNWDGFYAGVMGAGRLSGSRGDFGLGIDLGVATTINFVLAGAEVEIMGLGGTGNTPYVQGVGRAGVLLTANTLLYGAAGYGAPLGNGPESGDMLVGGGVELGLTNEVSVRAQYLRGTPVSGADGNNQLTLGAQFHF